MPRHFPNEGATHDFVTITKRMPTRRGFLRIAVSNKANSPRIPRDDRRRPPPDVYKGRVPRVWSPGFATRSRTVGWLYASGGFEEFSTDPVAEFSRPFNGGRAVRRRS